MFKQRQAYERVRSLVGSEICIRDNTTRSEVILPDLALPNSSTAYKVPRHLIFVDETDITVTRDSPELFFNVRETIDVYGKPWGVSEPRVWFLVVLSLIPL